MGIAPSISCKLNYLCHYFDFSIPCSLYAILYTIGSLTYITQRGFLYILHSLKLKPFFDHQHSPFLTKLRFSAFLFCYKKQRTKFVRCFLVLFLNSILLPFRQFFPFRRTVFPFLPRAPTVYGNGRDYVRDI